MSPERTTIYTLTAGGCKGPVERPVTVEVKEVDIVTLKAEHPQIKTPGEKVAISWNTVSALSCTMDNGIGPVPLNGSKEVTADCWINYTLTAKGFDKEVRKTLTIQYPGGPYQVMNADFTKGFGGLLVTLPRDESVVQQAALYTGLFHPGSGIEFKNTQFDGRYSLLNSVGKDESTVVLNVYYNKTVPFATGGGGLAYLHIIKWPRT